MANNFREKSRWTELDEFRRLLVQLDALIDTVDVGLEELAVESEETRGCCRTRYYSVEAVDVDLFI